MAFDHSEKSHICALTAIESEHIFSLADQNISKVNFNNVLFSIQEHRTFVWQKSLKTKELCENLYRLQYVNGSVVP